jgi:hypothetical protein
MALPPGQGYNNLDDAPEIADHLPVAVILLEEFKDDLQRNEN